MSSNKKIYEVLTRSELESPVWRKVSVYLEERLNDHRCSNDSMVLDNDETAALRGQILELKGLLDKEPASARFEDDLPDI
ncbi:hypothetical protein KAR91_33700 [Candidatus Pacearchaeota archaeon]|nr:hypothetical protein [Candidatus Pacearchaeota archaeon]